MGLLTGCVLFICLASTAHAACADITWVSREEWGARPPKAVVAIEPPVNMTFVHHTAGAACFTLETCIPIMQGIQNFHMDDRGWNDIGYSFLVGEDGRAYEGRGWNVEGAHTRGYNDVSFATSVMGTFTDLPPDQVALNTTQAVFDCGVELGYIVPNRELFGHRDAGCTECPGNALYFVIQSWPNYSTREIPKYC